MSIKQRPSRVKSTHEPLPTWVVGLAIGLLAVMLKDFITHFQDGSRRAALSALGWVPPGTTFAGVLDDFLGIIMGVFIAWVAYRSLRDNVKAEKAASSSRH